MSVDWLFFAALAFFSLGCLAVLPPLPARTRMAYLCSIGGSICLIALAVCLFQPNMFLLPFSLLSTKSELLKLDWLAASFFLPFGLVGVFASWYAIAYTNHFQQPRRLASCWNLFLAGMAGVFAASHVYFFFFAWEIMAWTSFLLVRYQDQQKRSIRTGFLYLLMTHIGTACLLGSFLLLSTSSGSLDFASFGGLPPGPLSSLIFLLAFFGFAIKAGLVPLHIWLSRAHPAAPSHVSALMSGIMLKTAVYGMCRFLWDFLPFAAAAWWGWLLVGAGCLSALMGALYAVTEGDWKRLLAFCSAENLGLIFALLGAGLLGQFYGDLYLASLAWNAALLHVFLHALYKSLLFLGVGSVIHAVGTGSLDALGGLWRRMPGTCLCLGIGSCSAAGLPFFAGFPGEWLLFQCILALGSGPVDAPLPAGIALAALGLAAATSAAAFLKTLALPVFGPEKRFWRPEFHAPKGALVQAPMGLVILTLLATWQADSLRLLWLQASALPSLPYSTTAWLLALAAVFLAFLMARRQTPQLPTWTCGIIPEAHFGYSATAQAQPFQRAFASLVGPAQSVLLRQGIHPYWGGSLQHHLSRTRYLIEYLYQPLQHSILRTASRLRSMQAGSIQLYMAYILTATVACLYYSIRW
ncbi:proton-conducting transporter membrane subunit [Anaeroarcus burkinensis]|uniref:proton-conducting transporter transmembrane domain-containing protein n=1 Tax=Anaeroarcus burkinensis TaxID=82376 RepID=UPI0006864AAE|nr:proton-conducting transporter membrane subunit [Anaeroarcus burkinensis]